MNRINLVNVYESSLKNLINFCNNIDAKNIALEYIGDYPDSAGQEQIGTHIIDIKGGKLTCPAVTNVEEFYNLYDNITIDHFTAVLFN